MSPKEKLIWHLGEALLNGLSSQDVEEIVQDWSDNILPDKYPHGYEPPNPDERIIVFRLNDGDDAGPLYLGSLETLMDAIKEGVSINTLDGNLMVEFTLGVDITEMTRAEFEALPPRN